MEPNPFQGLFTQLIEYSQLPRYQLERRLDAFLGTFILRVLQLHPDAKIGVSEQYSVIPELPLPGEENKNHYSRCGSWKHRRAKAADYFIYSNATGRMILLEFKSDIRSLNDEQRRTYEACANWGELRDFLNFTATNRRGAVRPRYEKLQEQVLAIDLSLDTAIELMLLAPAAAFDDVSRWHGWSYLRLRDIPRPVDEAHEPIDVLFDAFVSCLHKLDREGWHSAEIIYNARQSGIVDIRNSDLGKMIRKIMARRYQIEPICNVPVPASFSGKNEPRLPKRGAFYCMERSALQLGDVLGDLKR